MVFRFLLLLSFALPSLAAEVAGVKLAEKDRVGNAELVLNGAGLRQRAFFRVYAAALYLPERKATGAEIIATPGAKRVAMHMLRTVGSDQFTDALIDGLRGNHSEAEVKAFWPRIVLLLETMAKVGESREGARITIDWIPGRGTQVTLNGQNMGEPIAGEDFYRALLKNWIGENPVQEDLKRALLGGKS